MRLHSGACSNALDLRRYNIVKERDLSGAAAKMGRYLEKLGTISGIPQGGRAEARPGKTDQSFAVLVPGAGIEPALPLPENGF